MIAIGLKASYSMNQTYGWNSVIIGTCAGYCSVTGQLNTYVGRDAGKCATGGTYNAYFGQSAGLCATGNSNTMIGACAGRCFRAGASNVFVGKYTAQNQICGGSNNTYLGISAASTQCCGDGNIAIGSKALLPSEVGSKQLVIAACSYNAVESARCVHWIVGCKNAAGDTLVGIGTTMPDGAVGAALTSKLSVGIVSAYQLYGDGSNLTGLAGWTQTSGSDGVANLYAGDGAGGASDADTCYNIAIGCRALRLNCAGDHNIAMGLEAGCSLTCGTTHILIGCQTGKSLTTCYKNTFVGHGAGMYSTTGVRNTFYGFETGKCNVSVLIISTWVTILQDVRVVVLIILHLVQTHFVVAPLILLILVLLILHLVS